MREVLIAAACGLAALVLVPSPSIAKLQCKPGEVLKCREVKAAAPSCWCAPAPVSGYGSGDKAEIKKRNVPQVKPNK